MQRHFLRWMRACGLWMGGAALHIRAPEAAEKAKRPSSASSSSRPIPSQMRSAASGEHFSQMIYMLWLRTVAEIVA